MIYLLGYLALTILWGMGFKTFFLKDFARTWDFTKFAPTLTERGVGVFLLLAMLAYPVTFIVIMLAGYAFEGNRVWQNK